MRGKTFWWRTGGTTPGDSRSRAIATVSAKEAVEPGQAPVDGSGAKRARPLPDAQPRRVHAAITIARRTMTPPVVVKSEQSPPNALSPHSKANSHLALGYARRSCPRVNLGTRHDRARDERVERPDVRKVAPRVGTHILSIGEQHDRQAVLGHAKDIGSGETIVVEA